MTERERKQMSQRIKVRSLSRAESLIDEVVCILQRHGDEQAVEAAIEAAYQVQSNWCDATRELERLQ